MKKILVLQHVAVEVLGTLDPLLRDAGFRIRYANFGRFPHLEVNLKGYSGLIILGGPMHANDTARHPHLSHELKIIEQALKEGMPILGICLGAQLLAKALGAKVKKHVHKEIGWYEVDKTEEAKNDPLISHFRDKEKIFQWHGDTFEIPCGAVHLAKSHLCSNQAFKYGDKAYGFQFHLEVDESLVKRWLKVPHYLQELIELKGEKGLHDIIHQNEHYMKRLNDLGERVFLEFIKLIGQTNKKIILSSR